jgi:hypothetical protein
MKSVNGISVCPVKNVKTDILVYNFIHLGVVFLNIIWKRYENEY